MRVVKRAAAVLVLLVLAACSSDDGGGGAEPAERCDEAWLVDEATCQDRVRLRVATIDIDGAGRAHRARVARRIAQLCARPSE